MSKVAVSGSVVRAWGKENLDKIADAGHKSLGQGARGRLHPEVVTAYNRANKNRKYVLGTPKAETLIKQTVIVTSDKGRKYPKAVTLTAAEVRSLTGTKPSRGRISDALKAQAAHAKVNQA